MPINDQGSALHGDMCSTRLSSSGSCVVGGSAGLGWAGLGFVKSRRYRAEAVP